MKTGAKKKPMLMAAIKEEQQQAQLREAYAVLRKGQGCREKSRTAQMLRVLINAAFVVVRCAALVCNRRAGHHRAGNADLSQYAGCGAGNVAGDRATAC